MPTVAKVQSKTRSQIEIDNRKSLLRAAKGLSATLGTDFFHSIVKHLGTTLHVNCCLLGELAGASGDRIRTLAVYRKRRKADNFDQTTMGTALGQVLIDGSFGCRKDVRRMFPGDRFLEELQA